MKPVCPWCGSSHHPRRYRLHNGRPYLWAFRVAKRKVAVKHSAKSPRRYGLMPNGRPYMRGPASRTWAVCAHPFHDQIDDSGWPKAVPTLPPRVHNPDLAEMKRSLKRALQGKDRR